MWRDGTGGAARTPCTSEARNPGGPRGDAKGGRMLGYETHFLWALSFLALVLFFRAWSASTAGEKDG